MGSGPKTITTKNRPDPDRNPADKPLSGELILFFKLDSDSDVSD